MKGVKMARSAITKKQLGRLSPHLVCGYRANVAMHFPQVMGGVYRQERTCAVPMFQVFRTSGTAGWIALKVGVWLVRALHFGTVILHPKDETLNGVQAKE